MYQFIIFELILKQLTMKTKTVFWTVLIAVILFPLFYNCKKETIKTPPTIIPTIIFNPNLIYGTVSDNDGNSYKTIQIGTQVWMAENLKTTRYRNGDPIPNLTDGTAWVQLTYGAYAWYNNDAATYKTTYGALYNWYAVADSRNIAPIGWHVPTDVEWHTLILTLDAAAQLIPGTESSVAGGKLKETGFSHCFSPNTGATNSSGFTALPGGHRSNNNNGAFYDVGSRGFWCSSTASGASDAWYRNLFYDGANVGRYGDSKQYGFSVRCVRD